MWHWICAITLSMATPWWSIYFWTMSKSTAISYTNAHLRFLLLSKSIGLLDLIQRKIFFFFSFHLFHRRDIATSKIYRPMWKNSQRLYRVAITTWLWTFLPNLTPPTTSYCMHNYLLRWKHDIPSDDGPWISYNIIAIHLTVTLTEH